MQISRSEFLTTHAGSLPRSDELVAMQVAQSRGDNVDAGELAAAVHASTTEVIKRQRASGITVGNNGEQARESFFTYVKDRMSGFDGVSNRPAFQDMARYPGWLKLKIPGYTSGVSLASAPQAQGKGTYTNRAPLEKELREFDALLDELDSPFAERLSPHLHPALSPPRCRTFITTTSTPTSMTSPLH